MSYEFIDNAIKCTARIRKSVTRLDSEMANGKSIADLIFIQKLRDINRESYEHLDILEEILKEVKEFTEGIGEANEQK